MLFKNILFASSGTAGSDNAAKLAFGLAEKQQAELTLYHCCGVPSRGFTTNVTDTRSGSLEQPDEAYQEMVREELNTAYAYQIEACTRPFRMELSVGMPSTEILRYARQIKPDLIVMGASSAASDPNAARMRSIVGNTVRAVAKKAPCPVLIVNRPCTTCWHLFSNIVFCTDFSEAANHAFRFALNTARQLNAKLYITHAVDITSIQGMTMDQSEIPSRCARRSTSCTCPSSTVSPTPRSLCAKAFPMSKSLRSPGRTRRISSSWPTIPRICPMTTRTSAPRWNRLCCVPPVPSPA